MTPAALLLALWLSPAAPARAQDDPAPAGAQGEADSDDAQVEADVRGKIQSDPAVADSLAARIERSKIGPNISAAGERQRRLADIRAWIEANPQAAARLAVGLARDDANGTTAFEDLVTSSVEGSHLSINPRYKYGKGLYGNLNRHAHDSKLAKQQSDDLSDEEQREILKNMFEGQGGQSNKIITQKAEGKKPGEAERGGTPGRGTLSSAYYDRLSQSNLRGYSPQLQALQSALNLRRAPGAPRLIETGKLDYETLHYPAYGMRFDVGNLQRRLDYEKALTLARLLGEERGYTPEQLADPAVQKQLAAKAAGKALPEAFARRQAALARAAAALADFEQAAAAAKDPARVSPALLVELGGKQKEAARWITVASLEEELQRLDAELATITPDLYQTVQQCPAAPAEREAYMHRGEWFEAALKKLRADDSEAIARLQAEDWAANVAGVEARLASGGALRKDLSRNLEDYRSTAYRFAQSADGRPAWRQSVDGMVVRFLPGTSYARRLRSLESERSRLKDVFAKIAAGDLDAAHMVLASDGTAR